MSTVIDLYNPGGIDAAVLGGTGRGGILSSGYLHDDPLESYLEPDEEPVFVRSNAKKGVAYHRLDSGAEGRIVPGDGYRAFALVTDTRLIFVIGDTERGDGGDCSIEVPIGDIELVDTSDGLLTTELSVTTRADVCWRFPCRSDLDDVLGYLDVATEAWNRMERHLEDARAHVLDASEHREDHDYEAAMAAIQEARTTLDDARTRESEFVSTGVAAMADRIERTEDRVGEAALKTLRARATRNLNRAEQLWRDDEYAGAHEAFEAARADYVAALQQRDDESADAADLRERIASVDRNIASLQRAPVDRAEKACDRAYDTDDPEARGDLFERALNRYRQALELDWGTDDKRFEADTGEIRERIDGVASELVETRRRLAARRVQDGDRHREAGKPERAADRYRAARDLLDRTLETARELVPDAADPLIEHRDAVDRRLSALDLDEDDGSDTDAGDDSTARPDHDRRVSSPTGDTNSVVSPT